MHMADYKTEALAYLRQVIAQTGKSATELARVAGVNQTTFTRPLNNAEHKYAVKFQALQDLANQTGVPLPQSLAVARSKAGAPVLKQLAVRFEVGAGGFLERDELPQEPYGAHTVVSVAPYADAEQWLERVVSDSMDRVIPIGSLIHVVNAIGINYRPRHGDIVVVERTRSQGALVERTVKRLHLTHDGLELWPESHNPRWSGPVVIGDGRGEQEGIEGVEASATIVALVLRSYQFFVEAPAEAIAL